MKRKGFRSEFERGVAVFLIKNKIKYEYELQYLEYQPKIKRYTPDFFLPKQKKMCLMCACCTRCA